MAPIPDSGMPRGPGAGDMFLKVKGAKHGDINGEAQDQKHKNEIEVLAWSWGMQGKAALGWWHRHRQGHHAGAADHQAYRQGVDRVDVRAAHERDDQRSDADAQKNRQDTARVPEDQNRGGTGHVALDLEAGDVSGSPSLLERVSLSFNKISDRVHAARGLTACRKAAPASKMSGRRCKP